jgi:hypothetical protein
MTANSVVRARIDEQTKNEAAAVLKAMGLTVSDAFCVSAPNRDPTRECREDIGIACTIDGLTGSRSAPIGIPPLGRFP